jgi:hypothetical protein
MLFGVPGGALTQAQDPISLLYTTNYSTGTNRTDNTPLTWNADLGSAGDNKLIVIGVSWEGEANGTTYISSMTLGGNAMTEICTVSGELIPDATGSSLYMYETSATTASVSVAFEGTSTILAKRTGIYIQALDKASRIFLQSYDTQSTTASGTQLSSNRYLKKGQAIVVNTTGAAWNSSSSYNHSDLGSGIYEDRVSVGGEANTTQLTHAYVNNLSARTVTYTTENMTLGKRLCSAVFR